MKDIYYVIRWVRKRRGANKILGKYETVEEAKKHYPTREEMAKMMYEDVKKWEYKDEDNVMHLDDTDEFFIRMEGKGASAYLTSIFGPGYGTELQDVYNLDFITWRNARKAIKGADNKWENLFLEALTTIHKAITKQEGLYKWSKDEYEQGYTNGLKDAYDKLEICMSNMRRKMIMEKEKKDSQVQDKECHK